MKEVILLPGSFIKLASLPGVYLRLENGDVINSMYMRDEPVIKANNKQKIYLIYEDDYFAFWKVEPNTYYSINGNTKIELPHNAQLIDFIKTKNGKGFVKYKVGSSYGIFEVIYMKMIKEIISHTKGYKEIFLNKGFFWGDSGKDYYFTTLDNGEVFGRMPKIKT